MGVTTAVVPRKPPVMYCLKIDYKTVIANTVKIYLAYATYRSSVARDARRAVICSHRLYTRLVATATAH